MLLQRVVRQHQFARRVEGIVGEETTRASRDHLRCHLGLYLESTGRGGWLRWGRMRRRLGPQLRRTLQAWIDAHAEGQLGRDLQTCSSGIHGVAHALHAIAAWAR